MSQNLRLPKRNLNGKSKPAPLDSTVSVDQSGARQIRHLPTEQFDLVVESLRDGVKLGDLAAYFGQEGWLNVSEKTFIQYLGAFKRVFPEFLRGDDSTNLNGICSKRKPSIDEEQTLEQLLRVQSIRLKKGIDFELQTGVLNPTIHKDINATREIAESLARLRGKGTSVGRPGANNNAPMANEAKEQLRKLDQSEASQDKIATLFGQLAPLLKAKQNVPNV